MKKTFSILVIAVLILSSIGAVALSDKPKFEEKQSIQIFTASPDFSQAEFEQEDNDYVNIKVEGVTDYLMQPGMPKIPKHVETIELPFGIKNIKVKVDEFGLSEKIISKQIQPSPMHVPLLQLSVKNDYKTDYKKSDFYESSNTYPSDWYDVSIKSGLNQENIRKTFVIIPIYLAQYTPAENKIKTIQGADITIDYEQDIKTFSAVDTEYDLVVIAPQKFKKELTRFIDHKNDLGINTFLKTTEDIYNEFEGYDKPEQIKYFIKSAIEEYNISYVLLVGGLKSKIWAKSRDDCNQGSKWWYVPVRYNNLFDNPEHPLLASEVFDPGVITDLYYADIYEGENNFSSWDPNDDKTYAAWMREGVENDYNIDMMPDVIVGRLACRSIREVRDVVDKIIKYESKPVDPAWFKRFLTVSGDGFLDQYPLNIEWDTTALEEGTYIIYAQSSGLDDNGKKIQGPIEEIRVKIDRDVNTSLTFNHDDHTRIPGYPGQKIYPAPPIAEIVSVSEGDILGKSDYIYQPSESESYGHTFTGWAEVNFTDGILHINGKSYNPRPYGVYSDIHVWIEDENFKQVFSEWKNDTSMYFEGEWVVGNREIVSGEGGGAAFYMQGFEKKYLWASNGQMTNKFDFMEEFNQGYGFVFMSGHGSPNSWGDHYPGVPGNRAGGSFGGLTVSSIRPSFPFFKIPIFPMDLLDNKGKPSVVLIGGCHNSQFNVSLIPTFFDWLPGRYMWTHGFATPECFSWYMVKLKDRGAIATIGNTGLGYGILGEDCLIGGLDGGICIMFYKNYNDLADEDGRAVLGDVYQKTLQDYVTRFIEPTDPAESEYDDHVKTLQQWVLLGDPTLMIGGYSS